MILKIIISILHLLTLYYFLRTPFYGSVKELSLYIIIVPFVLMHWILAVDNCAITEIEKLISGKPKKDCITNMYFRRIYLIDFHPNPTLSYIIALILWSISFFKLATHEDIKELKNDIIYGLKLGNKKANKLVF